MWPLIIPPLVLVVSLGFLVWFLSRKSADPRFQAELEQAQGNLTVADRPVTSAVEDFGLRILERILQRLKLFSLQSHNQFQSVARWVRERRTEKEGGADMAESETPASLESEDKERFWDKWHRRHQETVTETVAQESTAHAPATADETAIPVNNLTQVESSQRTSRLGGLKRKVNALVSGEDMGPFARKRSVAPAKKLLSEEELIDRIAKNPKDAASYEELGDYYMATENLEDAKACYRQVIKLLPLNREVKDKVRKLERLLVQRDRHKE